MWQLQQALATTTATVLVSASGAAESLARALPSAGEGCSGARAAAAAEPRSHLLPHPRVPAAEAAVQLAVAAVLYNTQRQAPLLLAACTAAAVSCTQLAAPPAQLTADAPGPRQQRGAGALGRGLAAGEAPAAAAGDPAAGQGKHEGLQARQGCGLTAGPAAGVPRRAGKWYSREQLEVLVQHAKSLTPTGSLAAPEALSKLGLSGADDPKGLLLKSVKSKLSRLRNQLAHGRDPLEAKPIQRAKPNTYNWRAWLAQAYQALPDREGTVDDAAAILETDPVISKLLDCRPDPSFRDAPRWRKRLLDSREKYPEFEDTGRKQSRQRIFRYNEQVAEEWAARKGAKVPKRAAKGLPHLGKGQ